MRVNTNGFVKSISDSIHDCLGLEITNYHLVNGGGNSGVYRLYCNNGNTYALKNYPSLTVDPRNRLKVEFTALQFLHNRGETQVPAPILKLDDVNAGIYEWVEGEELHAYNSHDVDSALDFLKRLHQLRHDSAANQLPYASDACLSYSQVKQQLSQRWQRLQKHAHSDSDFSRFLHERYKPTEQKIIAHLENTLLPKNIEFASVTSKEKLTLSPSDFGFHNVVKRPTGQLVFIDFEYFGWDDPAKLISDFLWHPGMKLAGELKRHFVIGALQIYDDSELAVRLQVLYPLCGLRWCLILLNEFLPDGAAKRQHSGKMTRSCNAQLLSNQLQKAEQTLLQLVGTYLDFPYAN